MKPNMKKCFEVDSDLQEFCFKGNSVDGAYARNREELARNCLKNYKEHYCKRIDDCIQLTEHEVGNDIRAIKNSLRLSAIEKESSLEGLEEILKNGREANLTADAMYTNIHEYVKGVASNIRRQPQEVKNV